MDVKAATRKAIEPFLFRKLHYVPEDFKNFFREKKLQNVQSINLIRVPEGHDLYGKVESIDLVEFEPLENFKRQAIFIKDKRGNNIVVSVVKDDFKPTNRDEDRNCSKIVYGDASTMSSIEFFQGKTNESFERINQLAFEEAQNITAGCDRSGIRSNDPLNNIQLSGAHVIVIEDPEKQGSLRGHEIQETIGFLFGPNGPLNDIIVFPGLEQKSLMDQIKIAGGKTLLHGPSSDEFQTINIQEFFDFRLNLYKTAESQARGKMSKEDIQLLVNAFMSSIPMIIYLRRALFVNEEGMRREIYIDPPELRLYIKEQLNNKLQIFLRLI